MVVKKQPEPNHPGGAQAGFVRQHEFERPHEMRGDQTDKADATRDGHAAADSRGNTGDHPNADPGQVKTKARRRFLAECERAERAPIPEQEHCPDDDERQSDEHMPHRSILQRPQQPEGNLQRREGIRRQVKGQRRPCAGEA